MNNLNNLKIKETHNFITWTKKSVTTTTSPQPLWSENWVNNIIANSNKNIKLYNEIVNKKRHFSTSAIQYKHWSKGLITPLSLFKINGKLKLLSPKYIFTMDIETINFNNIQVPIAISSCGPDKNGNIESKLFLIDHVLLQNNTELALKQLWNKYFTYLENLDVNIIGEKLTIFAHNLGNFDGYFLYKGLMNHYHPDIITSIIDDSNTFISIKCNTSIPFEWKDYLRIFPISLDKLCQVF
jgi:hypothetical protein